MRQFMRFLWAIPPLLILASVVLIFRQQRQAPTREDWAAATQHIRAQLKAGDGVAWAPYWAGEGRLFLHDLPGFHLLDLKEADFARYDRVWLMGAFGHSADELDSPHLLRARKPFGALTLDLVEVTGPKVVGDVYAHLHNAQVSRQDLSTGRVTACDLWDGRGWHCDRQKSPAQTRRCLEQPTAARLRQRRRDPHCGLNPWLHVSRDARVIGGGPRRCLWMHPIKGQIVRLRWPSAPAGDTLVVDYGFTDKILTFRSDRDGPPRTQAAQLKALRGEAPLGTLRVEPTPGWRRWEVKAGEGDGPLVLEVTTTETTDAHLCVDPTIRKGR
ncbi:hypothetical protein KKF91_08725 [Myxococcota bacterium]|nr:hypothetical protein [Myxococcota bacterium]MBU1430624.1 hypothetical protein [Myxococcota bacterium]MBU1898967.1 hypothetical protein [Myxococcota bacterium]